MTRGVQVSRAARRGFWAGVRSGLSPSEAAVAVGASQRAGRVWIVEAGGVMERAADPSGFRLSPQERETIGLMNAAGSSFREIARSLGRAPSTVCREVNRNGGPDRYRPLRAQLRAEQEARRPKACKLVGNPALRERVEQDLKALYSPQQIAGRLRRDFADDAEMQVHHETIYRDLFLQSRGALRADLTSCLRSGRARRVPRRTPSDPADRRGKIADMLMIAERPQEVDERVVPGHWEGDLIIGKLNASAIGTVVERTTNYTMLLHLPNGHGTEQVTTALITRMRQLPDQLRRSITWDQGKELAWHKKVAIGADLTVYFCDPHSPWQRPVNENTNGLLRQYFPKGTDLSVHSLQDLAWVEQQLNDRPRKRLNYARPSELIDELLLR
jgi:transposase, IS30 family